MMNHLPIGFSNKTPRLLELAQPPFLLIDDGPVADAFSDHFGLGIFDIANRSFNPLHGINPRRARDIATLVYTANPEGENTLTVRNGRRALTRMLLKARRLDLLPRIDHVGAQEAIDTMNDLLISPVLKNVLCNSKNHHLPKRSFIVKLDRAELGDFDAFLLGTLFMLQFQGQIIVPDFGFYGRPLHISLIRQDRLVACLNYLHEIDDKSLRQALLGIKDKTIYRVTLEDAEQLIPCLPLNYNPAELTQQREGEYK
jgi:hypothetical protein